MQKDLSVAQGFACRFNRVFARTLHTEKPCHG